jgi:ElaB/YqjD/DUF883 family membrane-anchored ribosome-binding protein
MNDQYSSAKQIAAKELREALVSTEALLSALSDEGSEPVRELRERLQTTVAAIKEQLGSSFFETARDKYRAARQTAASLNRFAHRHPWCSVGIGVGLGVLVGRLSSD